MFVLEVVAVAVILSVVVAKLTFLKNQICSNILFVNIIYDVMNLAEEIKHQIVILYTADGRTEQIK